MSSFKNNQKNPNGSVYQPLSEGILTSSNTSEFQSMKIIDDLLKSTIPGKDLKDKITSKKHMYVNLKKFDFIKKKRRKQEKRNRLSRKDKINLGILKCPKTGWNYDELEPLRSMWKEHMSEVLNQVTGKKINENDIVNYNRLMSKADLHGAETVVQRSKNPNLVGISGTIVHESRDTFGVLSKDNKLRTIPKESCVFNIKLYNLNIVIFGKYLLQRTAERSVKKIKSNIIPTL